MVQLATVKYLAVDRTLGGTTSNVPECIMPYIAPAISQRSYLFVSFVEAYELHSTMTAVDDMKVQEMADAFKLSPSTVKGIIGKFETNRRVTK